uniref:mTERF1 protein n=1 Tax=Chlamydomonas reinhardtii TaxID=3055 RepID=E1VD13_CHLRE|nr:mTERF1 protein [Chlamydomonas reinhardtii]
MRALVGQRCLAPQRAPGSLHGTLRAVPSAVALRRARASCSYPESSSNHSATATTTTLESQLSEVNASPVLVLGSPALQGADHAQMCAALEALRDAVPRRSLGGLLERYPAILTAPVASWVDFLGSFGFQRLAVQELLLNSPDVLANSSVFRAGQVFLFLKRLGVPNDQIVGPIFKWRALLSEQVDFEAAADFLASEAGIAPELLGQVACQYPALLAAPVATELAPRLAFLRGLGPEAPGLLRGVLHEDWYGWVHGLANWPTAVAPKLAALEAVVEGGPQAAAALLRRVPEALKYPPESRLVPNLRLLQGAMGLDQQSLAALLRGAPEILSLAPEQLESRWTFLTKPSVWVCIWVSSSIGVRGKGRSGGWGGGE